LKTQSVAQALGLSVSTIKRWVDSGAIQAVRTVGKHRLIPKAEAIRMARELKLESDRILNLGGSSHEEPKTINGRTCDTLCSLLSDGHALQARRLIQAAYFSGCRAAALADQLIRPVMSRIGHGWMVGALDVYQEHQASQIVGSAIEDLIARISMQRAPAGRLALGATTEGDPYRLSNLLGELLLAEMGWRVRNLGTNLPLVSLASATSQYRPSLVFLSINYLRDRDRFVREFRSFYETALIANTAVVIGGHALDTDIRAELRYTAFGDRMVHLADFARQFASAPLGAAPPG
jgi:excisionase family DNA binding protein